MNSTIPFAPRIQTDPALHLRTATEPLEISQLRAVLDHEHYLKAGRPAGHVLWQGIYQQDPDDGSDTLVAVLCWGGAAKHLKDRDTWIGWDAVTCANRLKLVVQLRRFVVPGQRIAGWPKSVATIGRWKTKTTGAGTPPAGGKTAACVAPRKARKTYRC